MLSQHSSALSALSMGTVPLSSSWLGRDHRGPRTRFPWLSSESRALSLRRPLREQHEKKFGARVEAIFSARLTVCIGSDSQSADDEHRLLPFPGAARSQGRAWNGHTRGAIVCFRCWCGDGHLLELHRRHGGERQGQALTRPPLEHDGRHRTHWPVARNETPAAPDLIGLAADAPRDAIDASPTRQRALSGSKRRWPVPSSRGGAFRSRRFDLSVSAAAARRDYWVPRSSQGVLPFRCSRATYAFRFWRQPHRQGRCDLGPAERGPNQSRDRATAVTIRSPSRSTS